MIKVKAVHFLNYEGKQFKVRYIAQGKEGFVAILYTGDGGFIEKPVSVDSEGNVTAKEM